MSFKEIIGQNKAVSLLKTSYRSGRIAGAYVFIGPNGVGKKKIALNFAKLLVCYNPKEQEPCDQCASCLKVEAFSHPDVQWVSPQGQFIKIDSIREARRRLSLKSFESGHSVLVVADAQCLNEESSNALLKTLEEPTPQTVIILTANTRRAILPTIASRCQRVAFSVLSEDDIQAILREKSDLTSEAVFFLSRICEGHLGTALKFMEDELFLRKNDIIKEAFDKNSLTNNFIAAGLRDRSERNIKIKEMLCVLSSWLRDLMLAKIYKDSADFINVDRKDEIMRVSRIMSLADLEDRMSAVAETAVEIDRNISPRISLAKLKVALWK